MPGTISPVTSIQGALQWQQVLYQPYATGLAPANGLTAADPRGNKIIDALCATTGSIANSPTYDNTAGTITGGNNTAFAADGITPSVGDVVLVRADGVRNGVYVVTRQGDGSSLPFILTRHVSYRTAEEMIGFVRVMAGSTLIGAIYMWSEVTSVGITAPSFSTWQIRWRSINPLPDGLRLNVATGAIYGAPTTVGVWIISLVVSDDVGATFSTPITFPFGVEPGSFTVQGGALLYFDLATGQVTSSEAASASGEARALFSAKEGDELILYVQCRIAGTVVDLGTLESLKLGIRHPDTGESIIVGGGESTDTSPRTIGKIGSGTSATYLLYANFTGPEFSAVLDEYDSPDGTRFRAETELEIQQVNTTGVGPATLVRSSVNFPADYVRDIVE